MDVTQRRALLDIEPNPNRAIDYLITLKTNSPDGSIQIQLRYIPDRLILSATSFHSYVQSLFLDTEHSLEHYANRLADDIHDELVTRWINVSLIQTHEDATEHAITIEDRQPQWDNPQILTRLKLI
jgi:7-cyano-7-deazaguanine reductase